MSPNQHSQFGGYLTVAGIAILYSITNILQAISPLFSTDFSFFSFSFTFLRFRRWQGSHPVVDPDLRLRGWGGGSFSGFYSVCDVFFFYPK